MNPDSNVVRISVFRVALVTAVTAALGCGSSSPKRTADSGQPDAGKDGSARDVGSASDAAVDVPRADQALPDVDAGTDAAGGDAPLVTDLAGDRSVDGAADDVPNAIDVASGIDVSKTDLPPAVLDGASVDSSPIDVADALPRNAARITFAFKNVGSQTVYLQVQCDLEFQVVSDATSTAYPNKSICLCNCSDPMCTSLPGCAPCAPRRGSALEPGKTYEYTWAAQTNLTLDKTGPSGVFKCLSHEPLAPGPYHVSIAVFHSESDAADNLNATTAATAFQLTISDATVEVPVQ
jgi:hypothetical protein